MRNILNLTFDRRPVSDTWVDLGGEVKGKIKLFQNMVMLHIKLNGITGAATCNMVANIMPTDPPPPWGSKGCNSTFSEHGHIAYKIKGNHKCSNMVANILPAAPPPSPDPRVKRLNLTFAEHDHVAYQIKGNREYSNMEANILPAAPLSPQKVKIQLFQNMVILHIKVITNAATW